MYGFAWAQASAGLVVNIQKLKRYGINELPRTSKEFLAEHKKLLKTIIYHTKEALAELNDMISDSMNEAEKIREEYIKMDFIYVKNI